MVVMLPLPLFRTSCDDSSAFLLNGGLKLTLSFERQIVHRPIEHVVLPGVAEHEVEVVNRLQQMVTLVHTLLDSVC